MTSNSHRYPAFQMYHLWERVGTDEAARLTAEPVGVMRASTSLVARHNYYFSMGCRVEWRLGGRGFVAERDGKLVASAIMQEAT